MAPATNETTPFRGKLEGTVRSEFRHGSYRRTVTLPAASDTITATHDDGMPVGRGS